MAEKPTRTNRRDVAPPSGGTDGGLQPADADAAKPGQPIITRGWRTRGRLPHADFAGLTQAVTFRLADAMPAAVVKRLQGEVAKADAGEERRVVLLREHIHSWLDAGHGTCLLRDPVVQVLVAEELHRDNGISYHLEAFVIMPNHVHVVVEIRGRPLGLIVGAWKGASSRRINLLVRRSGPLWSREYHDRFIRDDGHVIAAIRYLVGNPVHAGLVPNWHEWTGTWVSERWREALAG